MERVPDQVLLIVLNDLEQKWSKCFDHQLNGCGLVLEMFEAQGSRLEKRVCILLVDIVDFREPADEDVEHFANRLLVCRYCVESHWRAVFEGEAAEDVALELSSS